MNKLLNPENKQLLRSTFENVEIYNYLTALELAYAKHYDICLSPDHIWFTFLSEVTGLIKRNPEKYSNLFTDTPEKKKEIIVDASGDSELINTERVVAALQQVIPSDVSKFFPKFSTASELSDLSCRVAFCDAVSPFYNYGMMLCKVPDVIVLGDDEDWLKLINSLNVVGGLLDETAWVKRIEEALINIILHKKPIFNLERCGSGGQVEVEGEFKNIFYKQPKICYVRNFPTGIAQMEYKNYDSDKNFTLQAGIFGYDLEDNVLNPEFGIRLFENLS